MEDRGPVRVLQVFFGMNRAGLETWLMHALGHLDRERLRVDFMLEMTQRVDYGPEIGAFGARVIPAPPRRRPVAYARNFARVLRDYGPYEVVHCHYHHYNGYVLGLAHGAGVPKRIAHSHNDFSPDDEQRGLLWRAYAGAMRWQMNRSATVGLAASREAAGALFGPGWEADPRHRLLYYGVDLEPFQVNVDPATVRSELGIPPDAFVVGHVGRFYEQKNHGFLVDVAAEVLEREPKAYLLLVGDGPRRPEIKRRVARAGISERVVFAGSRPDVPRLMLGAMDVFVLPSLYEGLPLVGIEAQAAGLPVVVSDRVSGETDMIHPLIQRLSLSQPASVWARKILATRESVPPGLRSGALGLVEDSRFNIASSAAELEGVYLG